MRMFSKLVLRFRSLFRRRDADHELDDELRFHLDRTIEQNLARGMTPDEARRQALLELGGAEQVKEECRDARGLNFLEDIWRDICYACRMLRKSPGFTLVAVLTLALGIGANVSMLGVVDALFFRLPAHMHAPEQMVQVGLVGKQQANEPPVLSYRQYRQIAAKAHFLYLAAEGPRKAVGFGRGTRARPIYASYVSHTYFRVLGTPMLLGRAFDAAEDQPTGSPPAVVLGYDLWQQVFGGDPKTVGRTVQIDGQARTVVGVTPKGFTGTGFLSVGAWLPVNAFHEVPLPNLLLTVIGRLRKHASAQQAAAETTSLLGQNHGLGNQVVRAEPLYRSRWETLSPNERLSLWTAGVALIVLLIACVNVSSLLLARTAQRRHEMAVRQQLGATRGQLVRQVLIEGLLLGAAGGAAALLVALLAQPLVGTFLLPEGFYEGSFLNWRLLGMAALLAILAGCASGLVPAWRASGPKLAERLRKGEGSHTREGSRLRWALVAAQLALALLLAIGAGLFIRSLRKVDAVNLGFQPDHLLQVTVDIPALPNREFSAAEIRAAYARLRSRAEHVPGVAQVALANMLTVRADFTMTTRDDSGRTLLRWTALPRAVTPNYFSTMEIGILEGRPLLDSDTEGARPVVVVNQSLARELWPGQSPLGNCLRTSLKTKCARVVGVVPDTWPTVSAFGPKREAAGEFYVPLRQAARQGTIFPTPSGLLIRTGPKPAAVTAHLFSALESVSPAGRYVSIQPYTKMLDSQTRSWRLGASMFSLFGALALVLAAVGIYGVLAFLVRQRTAEIGVRMAFGATPGDVLRMVVGEGMKFTAFGVLIGIGAAFGLMGLMKSLLYGVSATDPLTFGFAAAVLGLVALLACLLAAWRATRVDPNVALRYE